MGTS
jgi:sorbitol-specific phosphotransferase system component IIC